MLGASILASVAGGGRIKTLLLTPASCRSLAAAQVSEASGRLLPSQMNSCRLLSSAVILLAGAHRLIMEVRISSNLGFGGESSRVQPCGLCTDGVTGNSLSLSWNVQQLIT